MELPSPPTRLTNLDKALTLPYPKTLPFLSLEVAIVPNSNHLQIYQKQESSSLFTLKHTLTDHDKLITCVDWAPKTNRIVTCSQDRNAYVWYLENGIWVPTLVLLRINRAATYVRWSPKEDKFAVARGARLISVCYFEEENNWYCYMLG